MKIVVPPAVFGTQLLLRASSTFAISQRNRKLVICHNSVFMKEKSAKIVFAIETMSISGAEGRLTRAFSGGYQLELMS